MPITGLHQYFDAERRAGVFAAVVGAASLCLGRYLWLVRSSLTPAAWPLGLIGVVELSVGIGLVWRTRAQVPALEAGFGTAPQSTAAKEIRRMRRVNQSLRLIMWVEALLLAGGACFALFLPARNVTWQAVGIGVFVQAAVMLTFDLFAERRASAYTRWLSTRAGAPSTRLAERN